MTTLQEIQLEKIRRERARRAAGGGQPAPAAPQAAPEPAGQSFGSRVSDDLKQRLLSYLPEVKIGTPDFGAQAPETNGRYTRPKFDIGTLQPDQREWPSQQQGNFQANPPQGTIDAAASQNQNLSSDPRQIASDVANTYADSWTWGLGDRAIRGANPDAQKQTADARERLGAGAIPVDIGAALTSPSIIARGPMLAWKGGKTALHGIEGGAAAATDAWAKDTPLHELPGVFLEGSGISAAASKTLGKVSNWLQRRGLEKNQTFKNAKELRKGAKDEYRKVDNSASRWKEGQFRKLRAQLSNMDLTPGVDDAAINFLKKLEADWTGKSISPRELDNVRKNIGLKVIGTGENAGNMKGNRSEMTRIVDDFTKANPPTKPLPRGQFGPEAPDRQVMIRLDKARELHSKRAQLARVEREEKRAAREHTRGMLNPFGPSLESGRIKKFNTLGQQIEEGKPPANFPPKVVDKIEHLGQGTLLRRLGGAAEHLSPSGSLFPWAAAAAGTLVPGSGFVTAPTALAAETLHRMGQKKTNTEIKELKALIRDPKGRGLEVDKNASAEARRKLARIAASVDRGARNRGED